VPSSHRHRPLSWLHLIPTDPTLTPPVLAVEAVRDALCAEGLAVRSPEGLAPGPAFSRWLLRALPAPPTRPLIAVPMAVPGPDRADPQRGEVRVEAGVLRAYPDPGPQGLASPAPRRYRAACPGCGGPLDLYQLRFAGADPLAGACAECAAEIPVAETQWAPPLPVARFEITFGGLDHRPSLRSHPVFGELEAAAGASLREVHVTL